MEARKVLVKENDIAIISCPFCRRSKKMSVAKYRIEKKRELRIKCSCDNMFSLFLEYRRHPRKAVRLLGKSINLSKRNESQGIVINNISLGGIGFYHFNEHRTEEKDRLQVLFDLDDYNSTPINTKTTVRVATKEYVGCEFNSTESFQKSLGFYLLR